MKSSIPLPGAIRQWLAGTGSEGIKPGNLMLKPCMVKLPEGRFRAECSSVTVPENRDRPERRKISLPITRILSTKSCPAEPIFHLAGGPGQSNMGFHPPAELLENHDVVLVGYRGVDGPVKLSCLKVNQALRGTGGDLMSDASQKKFKTAIQDCIQRFHSQDIDLAAYTIPAVIADLEAARTSLGYERIQLLSQSYGTRVALLYAQEHPDRIDRSIMIGVNPPGRFIWEPGKIDEQIKYYSRLYAGDPSSQGNEKHLAQIMRTVNNHMPEHWLWFPIDPMKVKIASFVMLFNRKTAASIFDTYLAASTGDPSGLALLTLIYDYAVPGMFTWGDFMAKGFSADFDPRRDYRALSGKDSVMGSPLSQLFWAHAHLWPAPTIPEPYRHVNVSDVPTLLISGSIDFSTPAEYAALELLPYLKKGHQVILSESGHTSDAWSAQPEAAVHLIAHYFDTGEVDDSRFTYQPFVFDAGWLRFPRIAKILAAALTLTGIGLISLVFFWLSSFRKRARQTARQRAPFERSKLDA